MIPSVYIHQQDGQSGVKYCSTFSGQIRFGDQQQNASRCDSPVSDLGFTKVGDKVVCKDCAVVLREEINSGSGRVCRKCSTRIEGEPLRFQGDVYHPYHFNCAGCGVELTSTAREVRSRQGLTANKVITQIVIVLSYKIPSINLFIFLML